MRTIGAKWRREVKRLARKHLHQGSNDLYQSVVDELPEYVLDSWESAHVEVQQLINDVVFDIWRTK